MSAQTTDSPVLGHPPAATTAERWVVGLVLAGHALLAWITRQPAVVAANDDALYLLLARSLRHFTYRDLHIVGAPFHSQYPPGYPLMLALFGGQLGPGIQLAILLGIVLSLVALWFMWDLARRLMPAWLALAFLAVVASNTKVLDYAGAVRSEIPYLAVSVAALWVLLTRPGTARWLGWGAGLAILAALTRSVGLALVGAVGLAWLMERRWRRVVWYGVASAATLGVWLAWNLIAPHQFVGRSYAAALTQVSPAAGTHTGAMWRRLVASFEVYGRSSFLTVMSVPAIGGTSLDNAFFLGMLLLLLAGGLVLLWRRGRLVTLYTACYAILLTLWTYKFTRFLIPLLPIMLLAVFVALDALSGRLRPLPGRVISLGLALSLVVGGLLGWDGLRRERAACPREDVVSDAACVSPDERTFFRAVAYVRDSLPAEAPVVTLKEAPFALYSGHPAMHHDLALARFGDNLVPGLRAVGLQYLLFTPVIESNLPARILPACRDLRVIKTFGRGTTLFGIRPPGAQDPPDESCALMSQIVADEPQ